MLTPLILAGPSAVGKTTVGYALIDNIGGFELVRSLTTRQPRYDGHDDEYIFVSNEEFDSIYKNGGVLESTEYAGNRYGTPKSEIERITKEGNIPLLILDIEGVRSLSKHTDIASCAVYIYDDLVVLNDRLYQRFLGNGETEKGLKNYESRKEQNPKDLAKALELKDLFYAFVRNTALEETARNIYNVITDFKSGKPRNNEEAESAAALIASYLK